jgi:hypothetical protein
VSVLDTPVGLALAAVAVLILAAAAWIAARDRRRRGIARQNATHPHPSTRWLTPSTDPFDQTQRNRYTVPAQRRQP